MAKKERIIWWVKHPDHTVAVVEAPNWEQATVEAAKWWDVPWRKVAAMCELEKKAAVPQFVCSACGKIFYGREHRRVLCPLCAIKARDTEKRRTSRRKETRA